MRRFWAGPPLVLPRPADAISRRWSRLPPRGRLLLASLAVLAVVVAAETRVRAAQLRWGGPPVQVWVAAADTGIGEVPRLTPVRLPPRIVPAAALSTAPGARPVTVPLPAGAVITEAHVAPAGPAVGLPSGLRLVPVPVDDGWGLAAGGAVDVWIGEPDGDGATLVARHRAVADVRTDEGGNLTALVAVAAREVPALTGGLARGTVWLSHVPAAER